jgi:ParB family chromosome partitioning protein
MRVRQLQPVVVVGRADYLRLWPEHEAQIGEADYVLVNGERRVRAANQVFLPGVDAIVRPHLADSKTAFLDALFSENFDRKNFNAIEEARAVEAMVAECGSAHSAAQAFRRTEGWISQRRALLKLTPELQEKVGSGELPVRIARSIAALPASDQETAWRQAREAEQASQESRRQARGPGAKPETQPRQDPPAGEPGGNGTPGRDFTVVKTDGTESSNGSGTGTGAAAHDPPGDSAAVENPAGPPAVGAAGPDAETERESRADRTRPSATVMRWDDLGKVAEAIRVALGADDRRQLAALILDD